MPIAATLARGLGIRNDAPVPYVSGRGRWAFPQIQRNDAEAQMAAMGAVGTLFAIVNKLSTGTAAPRWQLYQSARSGKKEDRTEITRHAALDVLNRPNPFMPWQEFCEVTEQHIDLTGEGWWVMVRHERMMQGPPIEMWPVRPDRMAPVPDPDKFLIGYEYTGPSGQKIPLALNEVIQIRMPNPLDPYRGLGPVQALLVDLESARYAAEWNRNFFRNTALPGGIIKVDKRLGEDEFDEMRERWAEQHKGVANAHRVAIIEQGEWVDRSYSMKDMQFTELRTLSRDTILEAFGFPRAMLGATDGVNYAAAKAAEYMFSKWLIVVRLERLRSAINNELLPMFGTTATGIEADYESPVPEDEEAENAGLTAKVNAYEVLTRSGVDPDVAAEVVGLPPMKRAGSFLPRNPRR